MPFAALFSNNPIVAWGIVILVGLGLYKGKEQADRHIGARRQQRKIEAKSRKVQVKLQEKNNEKLEKTRATRADPPASVSSAAELSDDQRRRLIRD